MRKVISFTCGGALLVASIGWLYFTLFVAPRYPIWFLVAPVLLIVAAVFWLWQDFIAPWFSPRVARENAYANGVDQHLQVMFAGFEPPVFAMLKRLLNLDDMLSENERDSTSVQLCALYAAAILLNKAIAQLSEPQKNAALQAFRDQDKSNKLYAGVSHMLAMVDRFEVERPKRWLLYEVLGQLRGMSREQIQSWWLGSEVDRLADEIAGQSSIKKYLVTPDTNSGGERLTSVVLARTPLDAVQRLDAQLNETLCSFIQVDSGREGAWTAREFPQLEDGVPAGVLDWGEFRITYWWRVDSSP